MGGMFTGLVTDQGREPLVPGEEESVDARHLISGAGTTGREAPVFGVCDTAAEADSVTKVVSRTEKTDAVGGGECDFVLGECNDDEGVGVSAG